MREYTTEQTSAQLVAAATSVNPLKIVDFCAGRGSLLAAAHARWPSAQLYANDINEVVCGAIPESRWITSDFLSSDYEAISSAHFPDQFDLILLNPPFAFERTQQCVARGRFAGVPSSVAFAFLFTSLEYLSADGELLAVMPTSTLQSERDAGARARLKSHFSCRIISQPSYDRFPGLDVSTYLVSIRRRQTVTAWSTESRSRDTVAWKVSRGGVSIRRRDRVIQSGLHGWIHTTSISSSRIVARYALPAEAKVRDQKFVPKNTLIVPRVGKVKSEDLALTNRREILSDCLLGVVFDEPEISGAVMQAIKRNFDQFLAIYSGTGAPYTTQTKVSNFIDWLIRSGKLANYEGILVQ